MYPRLCPSMPGFEFTSCKADIGKSRLSDPVNVPRFIVMYSDVRMKAVLLYEIHLGTMNNKAIPS